MSAKTQAARAKSEDVDLFQKCYQFTRAAQARAVGLYPYFIPISGSEGTEVRIDGKRLIMIGSNNYMGLTHDPRVLEAAERAARRYGTGCTGSRFLNGTLDLHEKLEAALARFVKREAALVFSTGYQANLGTISCLVGKEEHVLLDKLDHASIVDGARMSGGKVVRYRHNDMDDLTAQLLKIGADHPVLIAVDGMFSMEGDMCRLPELVKAAKPFRARIMVDEAHSLGVCGLTGAGVVEHFERIGQVDLVMGTFSKSFASIGGFIAGEAPVIDFIKHHARSMMFSASMPPYAVATVGKCLEIIQNEPERRERLWAIARRMKRELAALGFNTGHSETPVIPIIIGDSHLTFRVWRELFDAGVFTNPVIAPAVPERGALLRTSYMATHTDDQLDEVLSIFEVVGKRMGLIG
jgi:8-amino-7-oxononanoate synthase